MYSQTHGPQSPDLSNNPFLTDPTNAQARFPDISSSTSQDPNNAMYNAWLQSQGANGNANMYGQGGMSSPPPQPGQQFQPSSGFGQHLVAQVNATGYSQIPGQMQPQATGYPAQYQNPYPTSYPGQQAPQTPQLQYSNTGFPTQQQQQYGNGMQSGYGQLQMQPQPTGYHDVAQFDPYGPIAQGWGEGGQQQQQQQQQTPVSSATTTTHNGHLHPRDHIRTHKAELEIWDQYAWKQALSAFDVLKEAWAARKKETEARIVQVKRDYGYTGQQEVDRLQGVCKDADNHFDSVAASSFQMHEVFHGYRQSGDAASKKRVREATNAALTNLPDWPPQGF